MSQFFCGNVQSHHLLCLEKLKGPCKHDQQIIVSLIDELRRRKSVKLIANDVCDIFGRFLEFWGIRSERMGSVLRRGRSFYVDSKSV